MAEKLTPMETGVSQFTLYFSGAARPTQKFVLGRRLGFITNKNKSLGFRVNFLDAERSITGRVFTPPAQVSHLILAFYKRFVVVVS